MQKSSVFLFDFGKLLDGRSDAQEKVLPVGLKRAFLGVQEGPALVEQLTGFDVGDADPLALPTGKPFTALVRVGDAVRGGVGAKGVHDSSFQG